MLRVAISAYPVCSASSGRVCPTFPSSTFYLLSFHSLPHPFCLTTPDKLVRESLLGTPARHLPTYLTSHTSIESRISLSETTGATPSLCVRIRSVGRIASGSHNRLRHAPPRRFRPLHPNHRCPEQNCSFPLEEPDARSFVKARRQTKTPTTMHGKIGLGGRHRTGSTASNRSASDGEAEDDTLVVEPDQGNVLMHIISQLRPGADLSRVVLPTFILEPRSMLERITNFMCHPEMLLPIPKIDDPTERFVSVVKFYLSGWHIRPPGVKKPLNPILGEVFTCYWDFPDNTRAYYISEQTSHHPPKSSYFYMAPDHHIRVDGTLKPRSKFLGNSAASMMEGTATLTLLNRGKDPKKGERYHLTQPNMYARGILFGKMKYELGDHSFVRCPELNLVADVDFKTKGWVGGTYNAIGGTIRNEQTGESLYELSGLWSDEMFIKDLRTGHKEMFFNGARAKPSRPQARPLEEQDERESQKLWYNTAQAVLQKNHELATDEKTKIEDRQREEAAARAAENIEWHPRLFRRVQGGPGGEEEGEEELEWIINAKIDAETPAKQAEQIMAIYPIIDGQKPSQQHMIPPHASAGNPSTAGQPASEGTASAAAAQPPSVVPASAVPTGTADPNGTAAAAVPVEEPTVAAKAGNSDSKQPGTIQHMLEGTGQQKPEGPLMDFTADMKKDLPKGGKPTDLKRSETEESHDEFFDVESR